MKRKLALIISSILLFGTCFSKVLTDAKLNSGDNIVYAQEQTVDMSKLLDMNELYGWAASPGDGLETTTGGGKMTPVVVSSLEELKKYVTDDFPRVIVVDGIIDTGENAVSIGSNKTITGIDENSGIAGGIHIYNSMNVIINNLNFNGGWPNSGPDDCIDISGSHHVWLNHLNVYNSFDGNIDIKMGSDYITVSWCKLSYTDDANDGVIPDHDHRLSCLIGSGAGDHDDTDMGKLRVSYHHNWFADNLDQRMPRVMYGRAHIYNNYYTCEGNTYCIGVDSYASALIENNYFKNVNSPHKFMYPTNALPASITARGNEYDNLKGSKDDGQKKSDNEVVEFDSTVYDYKLNDAEDVPEIITAYAGPKNDVSDKNIYSDKIESASLIKGTDNSYVPSESVAPVATQRPANVYNNNPVTYDDETDTYTYHGSNGNGDPAYYNIKNPFKGKDFSEDKFNYMTNEKWDKGITISYWVNVPRKAKDAVILSFNLENDRQIERKDAVKYNLCQSYSKTDNNYSMGEVKTYVDSSENEYQVLTGEVGSLVQYNPDYPAKGCYEISDNGGALCVHEKGTDASDEANWVYLNYLGEGYYENYSKRFDEEGGSKSKLQEAYISGSFCIYASGSVGFRQDNGNALQINPNLENYGNKIDIQTTNQFYYFGNGGYQSQLGSTFIAPTMADKGNWHFVVAVIQNDWVQFYMDGKAMTDIYLTSWGAALVDKQGVAGSGFNYGYGYPLQRQSYYPTDIASTAMTLLDFISDEDTVLTVGGKGAASKVLGQNMIGTPDGTMVKEFEFYDKPVKSYCILKDKIDLNATEPTQTPQPSNTPKPTNTPAPQVVPGDVDFDNKVTLSDALLVLKISLGIEKVQSEDVVAASDYNSDGNIDLTDALLVLKAALGINY